MTRYVGIMGVLALLLPTATHAAPLNLSPVPPDVSSQFVDVNYTLDPVGSLGTFTADGFLDNLTTDGVNGYAVDNGESHLIAYINEATGMLSSGSILLTGDVPDLGYSGTLLTGNIIQFGFTADSVDKFEFVFVVTGGAMSDIWPDQGGAIVSSPTTFTGTFTSSFETSNLAASQQDTFSVPAPGAAWGIPALLMTAILLRRRIGV